MVKDMKWEREINNFPREAVVLQETVGGKRKPLSLPAARLSVKYWLGKS